MSIDLTRLFPGADPFLMKYSGKYYIYCTTENNEKLQSPSAFNTDKDGITALLKSLSKLPFGRTATGGLNLTFSQNVSADILKALAVSYFKLGGLHIGISVVNAEMLKDAMKNPNKYKSLTVRLYGFSEYFVSLPKWQQTAILNSTQHKA